MILSATVLIMLILVTTVVISGNKTLNNSKRLTFATEINGLEQAIQAYTAKNNGEYPVTNSLVVDISLLDGTANSQFAGENITSGKVILNEIDYTKIGNETLKYGTGKEGDNDIYGVSTKTGKVYYAKGLKIGDTVYFGMTDELKEILNYNTDKGVQVENSIAIFSPSQTDWTNENVDITVRIPEKYELTNMEIAGTTVPHDSHTTDNGYAVYHVTGYPGNYDLKVYYRKSKQDITERVATYQVNNVDKNVPILQMSAIQTSLPPTEATPNLVGYLTIQNKKDDGSGLKYVKYEANSAFAYETDSDSINVLNEEQKKNMKAHFETNGKKLSSADTIIPVQKGDRQITIYAEDKAGNWVSRSVPITLDSGSGMITSSHDYIKNGLVVLLDGIDNTGTGHNNATTSWKDLSGNRNHASLYIANNSSISGWAKDGINLNAISDYLHISDSVSLPLKEFTVEVVFKVRGSGDRMPIIRCTPQYDIYMNGYSNVVFSMQSSSSADPTTTSSVPLDQPCSISASCKNNSQNLYFNGEWQNGKMIGDTALGITGVYLGRSETANYMRGAYYSVRIYNRELSREEIAKNKQVDKARFGI